MKTDLELFVVCRYERWCSFWFKELLNHILTNESSKAVAQYNSRYREIVLNRNKKAVSVRFVSETRWYQERKDGHHDYLEVFWNDGEVDVLYSKIKESIDG